MKRNKLKDISIFHIITFIVLTLYSLILLALFAWGIFNSLKGKFYFNNVDKIWPQWPWEWEWENISIAWEGFFYTMWNGVKTNPYEQLFNSLMYACGGAFMCAFATCLVSYIVAKFKYFFCEIIYVFVVVAMTIPLIGSAPAMILLLKGLGLFDTIFGMLLMRFSYLNMYFLVFFAAYKGISNEYREAAIIDGASELTVFIKIMIPLILPVFSTVFLIMFIENWNDYQFAYLYMPTHPTLAYSVLYVMTHSAKTDSVPLKLASSMILAVPVFILFIIFRNKIMGNVTMGGVKE